MTSDEHALNQFVTTITKLRQEITSLTDNIENYFDYGPDNINWGHVGTARHILKMIQEINTELA